MVFSLKGAAQVPASKDKVNLGFIGSGIRGKQLIDEFMAVPAARGVAVADLYDGCLERAKEQLGDKISTTKSGAPITTSSAFSGMKERSFLTKKTSG